MSEGRGIFLRNLFVDFTPSNRALAAPTFSELTNTSLIFHENIGGLATPPSHTIRRHVGKTDAELALRFEESPRLTHSSSFPDLATAEAAIGDVMFQHADVIYKWIAGGFEGGDLALVGRSSTGSPVGRVLSRDGSAGPTDRLTVVLRADPEFVETGGWRLHTAFPSE